MPRLLVVEDDSDLRFILNRQLTHRGHEVTVAADAEEALDRLGESDTGGERFDLMLLDLRLPGRDGLDLLEAVRQTKVAVPPVVVLTALYETEMLDRALARGAIDYLVKPVDFVQLHYRIDLALGGAERSPFPWTPMRRAKAEVSLGECRGIAVALCEAGIRCRVASSSRVPVGCVLDVQGGMFERMGLTRSVRGRVVAVRESHGAAVVDVCFVGLRESAVRCLRAFCRRQESADRASWTYAAA